LELQRVGSAAATIILPLLFFRARPQVQSKVFKRKVPTPSPGRHPEGDHIIML